MCEVVAHGESYVRIYIHAFRSGVSASLDEVSISSVSNTSIVRTRSSQTLKQAKPVVCSPPLVIPVAAIPWLSAGCPLMVI